MSGAPLQNSVEPIWVAGRSRSADERLTELGVPSHLLHRCNYLGLGTNQPVIQLRTPTDVPLAELVDVFKMGVGLLILPKADFDFSHFREALPWVSVLRLGHEPGHVYKDIELIEKAIRLEDLYIALEQPAVADISNLPLLKSVSAKGAQALSAALNPNLRELSIEIGRLPNGFASPAPLEKLWIDAGKTLRDLSAFADLTHLTLLEVRKANNFDAASLSEAKRLEQIEFVYCKKVVGIERVVDLPALHNLDFYSVHSVDQLSPLESFTGVMFVEGNFVFDKEFQSRFVGKGRFSPYKPPRREPVPATAQAKFVEHADAETFAPFELRDKFEDLYELVYEDWTGFEELLDGVPGGDAPETADDIAADILRTDAPQAMSAPGFAFDSNSEMLIIQAAQLADIELIARTLSNAWSDKRRIRKIARKTNTR